MGSSFSEKVILTSPIWLKSSISSLMGSRYAACFSTTSTFFLKDASMALVSFDGKFAGSNTNFVATGVGVSIAAGFASSSVFWVTGSS